MLATRFPSNLFVKILGVWEVCNLQLNRYFIPFLTRRLAYGRFTPTRRQVWHRLLHVAAHLSLRNCSGPHSYCRDPSSCSPPVLFSRRFRFKFLALALGTLLSN